MFSAKPYFPFASFLIFHVRVSSIFPGFVLWPSCDCSPGSHSNIRCTSIFVLNHYDRWSACIALYFSFPPSTSQVAPKDIRPAGFLTSLPWWKSWKSTLTKLHSDNAEPVNHHQHPHIVYLAEIGCDCFDCDCLSVPDFGWGRIFVMSF